MLSLLSKSWAGNLYSELPAQVNPKHRFVFYSHGLIVEGNNATPVHPRWGQYDFPAIKQALVDTSYHVIAYHRVKNTSPYAFAKKLAKDVNSLHTLGVPYEHITLVGFSRGGEISALAAHYIAEKSLNTVILAACAGLLKKDQTITVYGTLYSIYETSDSVGSCQFLHDRSPYVTKFKELAINTGKEHGAFYQPISQWLNPLKVWLNNNSH